MSTNLPAIPDTSSGDVIGRVEVVGGELVARLRPAHVRDVVARPVPPPWPPTTLMDFPYMTYVGPLQGVAMAEHHRLVARWSNPPWWSPLRWRPVHRRDRARWACTGPSAVLVVASSAGGMA